MVFSNDLRFMMKNVLHNLRWLLAGVSGGIVMAYWLSYTQMVFIVFLMPSLLGLIRLGEYLYNRYYCNRPSKQ